MKKLYSLIKATMTSDMNLFKINTKKNNKASLLIPLFIALYLMFMIWGNANTFFEKLEPLHLQYLLLPLSIFGVSIMTIIEGIYKSGSLIFNSKDDDLLLSLPLKRSTILFIRIFKFYIFELLFNSLFMLPIMIAYIRWAINLNWTYYLSSFIMLLVSPIIPIIISSFIGAFMSSISSRFKYKNLVQIILSMCFLLVVLYISFSLNDFMNYLISKANSINDLVIKIYYPAGIYYKLITDFNVIDLILFIFINIGIFTISIYILSKFYFKINSRLKRITVFKKVNINNIVIKSRKVYYSLIRKELNTFFKTPVFIINAGLGLLLFILLTIIISIKFNSILPILINMNLSEYLIMNNLSILILILILFTSYMTSITNSVISLEGKNINILKSLPIKFKTILMSKIYSSLILTTPILLIGDIILFVRFKICVIESFLLILLSILIPLVSHFIGIIINLRYPKLDYENSTEVVKQSTSSLVSLALGMLLLVVNIVIVTNIIGLVNSKLILFMFSLIYIMIDIIFYLYLINVGVKEFKDLSI